MHRRLALTLLLSVACIGAACSERPESAGTEVRQGKAAEIRNNIAYIPRTGQRYSGPLRIYYWSGEYVQATYVNGELHGTWTRYTPDGEVLQKVCFQYGRAVGCR
jgi:antitoxin component YwqK of YwqJK toxin-antitoxin module